MTGKKIDKIALVYLEDKKLLSARSKGVDKFYLPGGRREEGETETGALIREVKEELDVDLIPSSLKFMDVFEGQAHGKTKGTILKLTCYSGKFDGKVKPCSEIEEVAWLSYSERCKYPTEWTFLFDWLNGKGLLV